jgi:hypothetical protein
MKNEPTEERKKCETFSALLEKFRRNSHNRKEFPVNSDTISSLFLLEQVSIAGNGRR